MATNRWLGALFLASTATLTAQTSRQPAEVQAIAEEAYLFAYPMLENYRTLYFGSVDRTSRSFQMGLNELNHNRALADPSSRLVQRPNNDTLYSRARLDLRAEPVVISIPAVSDNRYWSLQLVDIYTHNVAIFSARNEPSTGTRYLVAGPAWKGQNPPGITRVVRSEGQFVYALVRLGVGSAEDIPRVTAIQDSIAITPLSTRIGSAAPRSSEILFPRFNQEEAQSEGFIQYVNFLLGQAEVHPSEVALLGRFAAIGVGVGMPFDPVALDPLTRAAIRRGVSAALEKIRSGQTSSAIQRGTWTVSDASFGDRERMQGRYLVRSAAAMRGLYGLDREEAVYMGATVDAKGQALDGSQGPYFLRFGPLDRPPAHAFWSLTMYDGDGFLVENQLKRYSIGDRTPGMVIESDGSLSIWIGRASPGRNREPNWLPAPSGRFSLSLRLYLPDARAETYTPPPVVSAK